MDWVTDLVQKVRDGLKAPSPYQPKLSRHAVVVALLSCVFFIFFDVNRTVNDDNNILWIPLIIIFYPFLHPWVRFSSFFSYFSQPLIGGPSYSNFSKWYVSWLFVAAAYHLPSSQKLGVSIRINLSLFLTTFAFSILCLLLFHSIFYGLRCMVSNEARKLPKIWTILQLSTVVSITCCVVLSHCKNRPLERLDLKDKVCSSWLAPVESTSYYNYMLSYMLDNYGRLYIVINKFDVSESPASPSHEISLVYSSWATFIGLYIANYVAEVSSKSGAEYVKKKKPMKPDFLDMVPWYSGTSADLYKTVFDLLVSVTVFLGRFDMRILQASMNQVQDGVQQGDYLYDSFSEGEELWFDFMADTGDGGNSTYTVARLLAQPKLHVIYPNPNAQPDNLVTNPNQLDLERGKLLLIGGDLAYPNPSELTYERRLFRPFEYALPSLDHRPDDPKCFIIPGNHDWFDGLNTFTRNICHKSKLGGWHMPQKKSYFALKLPKRWWIFGLDLALDNDLDEYQFQFFENLAKKEVTEKDNVIIMTHQPDWLVDWYENNDHSTSKRNVSKLIYTILKEKCVLRIAGDIHHYMHHEMKSDGLGSSQQNEENKPVYPQHLLVNGCGGAFAHPTHVFQGFNKSHKVSYECKTAYPTFQMSRKLALRNIWNFRKENWQFDIIGGIIYFILVFSMFPQCELDHIFQEDSISGFVRSSFSTLRIAFIYMLDLSYVSLGGAMLLLIGAISFVPSKVSWKTRALIGILHVSAHLAVALILMLVLELGVETFVQHELVAASGYHSLYRWYQSVFLERFPIPMITDRIKRWTFGLYPAFIKYVMSAFDVPELMAVTRTNICKNGMNSISRGNAIIYYASVFLYFWVLSTPAVSKVFGCYLYICINWFNLHYDEAFSSLRIAGYKGFTRFHINSDGDLEVYTLGVDKVPEEWEQDTESTGQNLNDHPSQWKAAVSDQEPLKTVRIIEKFVITRRDSPVTTK